MKKVYFLLCLLAILCAGCKPDVESSILATVDGDKVNFSAASTSEAASYDWEFGDGKTSTARNPTHSYDSAGTYTVTLHVTDYNGHISTYTSPVSVARCSLPCFHGTCVNGACNCSAGYEGATCLNAINAKFNGTYTLTESCNPSGSPLPYTVTVAPIPGTLTKAKFTGLWESSGLDVSAQIAANGTSFTIARQILSTGVELECTTGTITANGNTINLTYKIYFNGVTPPVDVCTAVLIK